MESSQAGSGSAIVPGEELAQEAGYSAEYPESLSAEEREFLLQGLQESGMLSPDMRSNRSTALAAASSHRSGAAATVD